MLSIAIGSPHGLPPVRAFDELLPLLLFGVALSSISPDPVKEEVAEHQPERKSLSEGC